MQTIACTNITDNLKNGDNNPEAERLISGSYSFFGKPQIFFVKINTTIIVLKKKKYIKKRKTYLF